MKVLMVFLFMFMISAATSIVMFRLGHDIASVPWWFTQSMLVLAFVVGAAIDDR